jgi:flavodoxin/Pyruvate/2-oxoacid:ferredoxin oxidoreductase delta subunit
VRLAHVGDPDAFLPEDDPEGNPGGAGGIGSLMPTRRAFLESAAAASLVAALPVSTGCSETIEASVPMKTTEPKTARVLWYSSTGNTRRIGQAVAQGLRAAGLEVEASDYRKADIATLPGFDLIVLGTPTFFADVPSNWRDWLEGLPELGGTPVGAFSTFGGPGDGQEHAAAHLLRLTAKRGGVPVGRETYGCMSVYAPTWSALDNAKRTLAYKHLPDASTYDGARAYAHTLLEQVSTGHGIAVTFVFDRGAVMRAFPQVTLSKLITSNHAVDTQRCIGCNRCVKACPTGAIDPTAGTVNTRRCLACLGCINNCPAGAVTMNFMGKPVYGFAELLKRHEITILEPEV